MRRTPENARPPQDAYEKFLYMNFSMAARLETHHEVKRNGEDPEVWVARAQAQVLPRFDPTSLRLDVDKIRFTNLSEYDHVYYQQRYRSNEAFTRNEWNWLLLGGEPYKPEPFPLKFPYQSDNNKEKVSFAVWLMQFPMEEMARAERLLKERAVETVDDVSQRYDRELKKIKLDSTARDEDMEESRKLVDGLANEIITVADELEAAELKLAEKRAAYKKAKAGGMSDHEKEVAEETEALKHETEQLQLSLHHDTLSKSEAMRARSKVMHNQQTIKKLLYDSVTLRTERTQRSALVVATALEAGIKQEVVVENLKERQERYTARLAAAKREFDAVSLSHRFNDNRTVHVERERDNELGELTEKNNEAAAERAFLYSDVGAACRLFFSNAGRPALPAKLVSKIRLADKTKAAAALATLMAVVAAAAPATPTRTPSPLLAAMFATPPPLPIRTPSPLLVATPTTPGGFGAYMAGLGATTLGAASSGMVGLGATTLGAASLGVAGAFSSLRAMVAGPTTAEKFAVLRTIVESNSIDIAKKLGDVKSTATLKRAVLDEYTALSDAKIEIDKVLAARPADEMANGPLRTRNEGDAVDLKAMIDTVLQSVNAKLTELQNAEDARVASKAASAKKESAALAAKKKSDALAAAAKGEDEMEVETTALLSAIEVRMVGIEASVVTLLAGTTQQLFAKSDELFKEMKTLEGDLNHVASDVDKYDGTAAHRRIVDIAAPIWVRNEGAKSALRNAVASAQKAAQDAAAEAAKNAPMLDAQKAAGPTLAKIAALDARVAPYESRLTSMDKLSLPTIEVMMRQLDGIQTELHAVMRDRSDKLKNNPLTRDITTQAANAVSLRASKFNAVLKSEEDKRATKTAEEERVKKNRPTLDKLAEIKLRVDPVENTVIRMVSGSWSGATLESAVKFNQDINALLLEVQVVSDTRKPNEDATEIVRIAQGLQDALLNAQQTLGAKMEAYRESLVVPGFGNVVGAAAAIEERKLQATPQPTTQGKPNKRTRKT